MSKLIYGVLLSFFYGVIGAGQVLGFLGFYRPMPVLILGILLSLLAGFLYFHEQPLHRDDFSPAGTTRLDVLAGLLAVVLFIALVALPILRWPFSPLGESLTWDAGAYHFPKAVELFLSGSAWDLSVAYGEYPFGYESLLSLCLMFTGDETLFGWVHLLIALFFCAAMWQLALRYTSLPAGLLLLLSVALLTAGLLPGEERPWALAGYAFTIGKNDFLLGTALLAVLLHSPVGGRLGRSGAFGQYHLFSLALASMVSLSVKPNSLLVVAPVGLFVLWLVWKERRQALPWRNLLAAFFLVFPGMLWAIRNLAVIGTVLTPASAALNAGSIFNNLFNPYLYVVNYPLIMLILVLLATLAAWVGTRFIKALSPALLITQTGLIAAFIFTPVTAFHERLDIPGHIAWRFGVTLLSYTFLILIAALENPMQRVLAFIKRRGAGGYWGGAVLLILLSTTLLWQGSWLLEKQPGNEWVLRDQFSKPVGVDGYWSAYDYVQKNIRHSVIRIENGIAYYLYGPEFTNTPTKLQYPLEMENLVEQPVPDYFVVFSRTWQSDEPGEFLPELNEPAWEAQWQMIYGDAEGRVYRKK